jgi:hypothetical protein
MKRLFLDDVRNPKDCVSYMRNKVYNEDWDIVRTYDEFVDYIKTNGVPDEISFDNDLADEHYHPSMFDSPESYGEKYNSFKEKTGYDCAKWLCNYCFENGLPLPTYLVHSMNPVGRDNIISILNSSEKILNKVM